MKRIIALLTVVGFPLIVLGQVVPSSITAQHNLNRMSGVNGMGQTQVLTELPVRPPQVVGDVYISEEWQQGSILVYNTEDVISGVPIRYDLSKNELEVQTPQGIKVIPEKRLKSFAWVTSDQQTSYFVSGQNFTLDGVPLVGCVEVLSDGATLLIKRTELELKKADYNVAMSVGSQDHEYIKKTRYFYAHEKELIPLPRSKKKIEEIFIHDDAPTYPKSFSARDENELKELFDFYNSQP